MYLSNPSTMNWMWHKVNFKQNLMNWIHRFPSPISIFTNPSTQAGYDAKSILKQSLTGLNSEFSFSWTSCLTIDEEPSQPYYLPIAGGRIIGFIPFPRVLVLCEMQSVSSRIWTHVAVSISYNDNHYTISTFSYISCHTKVKEPSLPYYLPIDGERIVGYIPFPLQNTSSFILDLNSVSN